VRKRLAEKEPDYIAERRASVGQLSASYLFAAISVAAILRVASFTDQADNSVQVAAPALMSSVEGNSDFKEQRACSSEALPRRQLGS
jgi:hypothetical protein